MQRLYLRYAARSIKSNDRLELANAVKLTVVGTALGQLTLTVCTSWDVELARSLIIHVILTAAVTRASCFNDRASGVFGKSVPAGAKRESGDGRLVPQ